MKRTRTNAKLLALILALVFAFELLPAHMASAAENISKWPALTNESGWMTTSSYIQTSSITSDEYPGVGNMMLKSAGDDNNSLIKKVQIPGLDPSAPIEKYNLTLSVTHLAADRKEAGAAEGVYETIKLPRANYYYPQRVMLRAQNGRECPVYIVAIPEQHSYKDEKFDYSEVIDLMLELDVRTQALLSELKSTNTAEAGGYYPDMQEAIYKMNNDIATSGLYMYWRHAGIDFKTKMEEMFEVKNRHTDLSPEQCKYVLTTMAQEWLDYCSERIKQPEIASLRVLGAEAVKTGTNEFTLSLPAGTDLSSAESTLEIEFIGRAKAIVDGKWANGQTLFIECTAWDQATGVEFSSIKNMYRLKLTTGEPTVSVRYFAVNDRVATIDEAAGSISLNLDTAWDWKQTPVVECSGSGYEFLDENGAVVAADAEGKTDLSAVKTLRIVLNIAGGEYTKDYALNITRGNSAECELKAYSVGIENEKVEISGTNVTVTIPFDTDWSTLKAEYTVSYDATIKATAEEDFEKSEAKPIVYRVTAQDGKTYKDYSVVVKKEKASGECKLVSFKYGAVAGRIDHDKGTITMTLPAGSNTTFAPNITISEFATIMPEIGAAQDFSRPVTYTVKAQDGTEKKYSVTVTVSAPQDNPDREKLQNLLNGIISSYKSKASLGSWEQMDLGIYANPAQGSTTQYIDLAEWAKSWKVTAATMDTVVERNIIALTANGYDCSNLAKYNNVEPFVNSSGEQIDNLFDDLERVQTYGMMGDAFALIALDMGNYTVPEGSRYSRDSILSRITGSGKLITGTEVDMGAMNMYAIAPYADDPVYGDKVKSLIQDGIESIAKAMNPDFTFTYSGYANSESTSQVICALCACGVDPYTDPRFGDGKTNIVTQWVDKFAWAGGFKHVVSETQPNSMATEQGCYALEWYLGFLERGGAGKAYHMYYNRYNFAKTLSAEANILSFAIDGQKGEITEGERSTIAVTVPDGMPLDSITPEMVLSAGAKLIVPELPVKLVAGTEQPFVVQASDGKTTKTYYVTVTYGNVDATGADIPADGITLEDANRRALNIVERKVTSTADGTDIVLIINNTVDLTKLRIKGETSYGAEVTPALDGKKTMDLSDFTEFTVVSGDKKTTNKVRIKVMIAAQAEMLTFRVQADGTWYSGVIDNDNNTITVSGVDDSALTTTLLTAEATFTAGSKCSPSSGAAVDFSNVVEYTLTGTDALAGRTYKVKVLNKNGSLITAGGSTPASSDAMITGFNVLSAEGVINHGAGTIVITLPYGTNVTAVAPIVTVSAGASVTPGSYQMVNLSVPVVYTVVNGKTTKQYTVSVVYQRSVADQLWDKMAEEGNNSVKDHQVSHDPHGLPGGYGSYWDSSKGYNQRGGSSGWGNLGTGWGSTGTGWGSTGTGWNNSGTGRAWNSSRAEWTDVLD